MPQAFYILFGAAFTSSVSLVLGKILLRRLRVRLYRQEEYLLGFVAGAACLSLLVFFLAAAQLLYKGVFLVLGSLILLAGWRQGVHRPAADTLPPLPRRLLWLYAPVIALFTVLSFLHAMAPEMSPDGSAYHLGLVAHYYRERGFSHITTSMYANLSQGVEMLFLFAYAFGRHSAAALTHFAFLVALPLLMLSYARRFGFPAAGLGAALFVYLSPVVAIDGASAYIDVAVAAILFAVYYLVQIWDQTRSKALLAPIGLLAGFAYGSKYTAFLALPYVLGFLVWKLGRRALRPALTVCFCALLMMVPWMAKNAIIVANPFSPFLNRLFPNPYVRISFEEEYAHHMRNYVGLKSHWEIPLEVTIRGDVLCGLLGPLFLLSPVALLALGQRQGRRLLAAGFLFGLVYLANIGTRFLIPPLPYIALAMAVAVSRWKAVLPLLVILHAVSAWPPVMKYYCATYAWRLDRILLRQALRLETEDGFLSRKWPSYTAARMIETATPPGSKVLTFNQTGEAYTTREIIVPYQSGYGAVAGGILWTPLVPDFQPTRRVEFRFPAEEIRKIRVRQTTSNSPDHWTVNELRVYSSGQELARSPNWRLRAHPNPWGVQDAFDNSPVTRWGSWQSVFSGMFIEVDFGRPERIDSVVVVTSRDVYMAVMELDVASAAGHWQTVSREPIETEMAPPLGLRREAAEVLKARGITHLLAHEKDFAAGDLEARSDAWGITLLGESFGSRLYRID